MSTTPKNTALRPLHTQEGFLRIPDVPLPALSTPVNQGDLMYWDDVVGVARVLDSDAHAATLMGVAAKTNPFTSSLGPTTDGFMDIDSGGIFEFTGSSSDTYGPLDAVYYGVDAQTVTNQVGSNIIGYIMLPKGVSSLAGGVKVQVWVIPKYPVTLPA